MRDVDSACRDDSDNIEGTRPILRSQLSLGMVPPSLVRIWSIHRLVGIVAARWESWLLSFREEKEKRSGKGQSDEEVAE